MDSLNFSYWLKGFIELNGTEKGLTPEQLKMVSDHLELVFKKVTPVYPPTPPELPKKPKKHEPI